MSRLSRRVTLPGVRRLLALMALVGFLLAVLYVAFGAESWAPAAARVLLWLALGTAALVGGMAVSGAARGRYWLALGPSLLLWGLGMLLPTLGLFFAGAGLGWVVVALVVLRSRVQMKYQQAIRHMRRGEYTAAIQRMNGLIKGEPAVEEHYRFRAELHQLAGHWKRAIADYERATELAPGAADGYLGLAEVYAQQGDYDRARVAARQAHERAPTDWKPVFHLGMIEDRCGDAEAAADHLEEALAARMPAQRDRLLARLWLARSYRRLGRDNDARAQLTGLRREARSLPEWGLILASEHGVAVRDMLGADLAIVERMLEPDAPLSALD